MAKPPRPTPLPLLAKINAIIIDLAALADAIEADDRARGQGARQPERRRNLPHDLIPELGEHVGGANVIPFPHRSPRR